MTTNTTTARLTALVAEHAELLDAFAFDGGWTTANRDRLNAIDEALDAYPWREVAAAMKAHKVAAVTEPVSALAFEGGDTITSAPVSADDMKLLADIVSGRRWTLKDGVFPSTVKALEEAGLVEYDRTDELGRTYPTDAGIATAAPEAVSALSFDGERIVSDDAREDELYGYETDDFAHVEDDGNDAPPEVGYYDDGEWIEGAPLNDTPEWAYTYDPIDAGKPEPDICGTLAARFDGIMGAASTPITDLKVGDWFVHLIAVEQVIKITSSAVVSTEAQHELFWKASVQRISDDDAAFIRVNWDGWRVWMIAGADGLRKTLRKPEPVHHIARPHVPADDITTILTPALAAHLAAIGSTYDRLTSGDITPAQANAEAAARMTARKLAGK